MASVRGVESMVYVWDETATAYRPIACITSNSFSSTLSTLESVTKCDPSGTRYIPDVLNETVSIDGEITDTTSVGGETEKASWDYLKGLQKASVTDGVSHDYWYDAGTEGQDYYFSALITDLSHEAPREGMITFSASLQVQGVSENVDPHAVVV